VHNVGQQQPGYPVYQDIQNIIPHQEQEPANREQNIQPIFCQEQREPITPEYQSIQCNITSQEQACVAQNDDPISQEQREPITPVYQSVQAHNDAYSSLSPTTKLPARRTVPINSGPYEDLQGTLHQYQSLDGFSRA